MGAYVDRNAELSNAARVERGRRLRRLWARYCRLTGPRPMPPNITALGNVLRSILRHRQPVGWYWLNSLEMADVGLEPEFDPAGECRPTAALPGTWDKIAVLAERVEHGLPLWHPADAGYGAIEHWEGLPG